MSRFLLLVVVIGSLAVSSMAVSGKPSGAAPVPFTPSFTMTLDEVAPADPFTLPVDDDCPVGVPCKAWWQLTIPDGQPGRTTFPNSGTPLSILAGSISVGGDALTPDGAIVGRALVSERIGLIGNCGTGGMFNGDGIILDATTNPSTTTGSSADLNSFANWPTQLNGVRDAVLSSHPGAVLYARWLLPGGPATNLLTFRLPDGSIATLGITGDPGEVPVTEDCGPETISLIFLGVSLDNPSTPLNEGGVPLITCTTAGTQNFQTSVDRNDTPPGDAVTLFDTATCSPNTPAGSNVSVPLLGGTGSTAGLEVTFSQVTTGGSTSVTGGSSGPPPPTGFQVIGLFGQPFYYDINTTTSFSGPVTVCVRYDDTGLTLSQENALKLMQNEGAGFVDTTSSVDTTSNIICGTATHLSIWAVMLAPPVGGVVDVLTGGGSGGPDYAAWALAGGAAALLAAIAGGGWWARRRE